MTKNQSNDITRETTRAWAEIDLSAIRDNFAAAKRHAESYGAETFAIMKANAYGHGAAVVARELERAGARHFAAATLDEALELIGAGVGREESESILVLSEVHPSLFSELCSHRSVLTSIYHRSNAELLSDAAMRAGVEVGYFIAIDTGMSRIGIEFTTPEKKKRAMEDIEYILSLPNIRCEGVFSHFACADETDKTSALIQNERFDELRAELEKKGISLAYSLCNSAALTEPEFVNKYDYVREGIGIYGLMPSEEVGNPLGVRPAMSVKARVTDVKTLDPGFGVSYGHKFVTERETRVATIPVGYADGYPRLLSGKAGVVVNGGFAPILGRVCMDQMMVDVSGIPDVHVDSVATIMGDDPRVNADHLAKMMGTIGYELICAVSPRIPRVYINGAEDE